MAMPDAGLTFLDLGPTPYYATSSWQILSAHFQGKREHIMPTPPGAEILFKEYAAPDAAWAAFSKDPEWKTLSGDQQYKDNVSAISKRVTAGNSLVVEAFDRTNSIKIADGKLSSLDNSIDVTTGTVKMRAQFANTDGALYPNQFVNVHLKVGARHDAPAMMHQVGD